MSTEDSEEAIDTFLCLRQFGDDPFNPTYTVSTGEKNGRIPSF